MVELNILMKRIVMKKKIGISIILTIILVVAFYYGYNLIKLNSVDGGAFSMEINVKKDMKHVGAFDGTLFYVDKNRLVAKSQDKGNLFEKNLGIGVNDMVYDKYVYVCQEDGLIRAFDRFDGSLVDKIKLDSKVFNIEISNNKLLCYGKNQVFLLDLNLKNKQVKNFKYRPVKYRFSGAFEAVTFLDREVDGLKSRFKIYQNDKEIYYISSVDELFMFTDFVSDNSALVLTNSYLYLISGGKLIKNTFLLNPRAIDVKDGKIAVADDESVKIYDKELKLLEEVSLGFQANALKIIKDRILLVGANALASYEDGNLIKTDVANMQSYFLENDGIYIILPNRVEKMKAY